MCRIARLSLPRLLLGLLVAAALVAGGGLHGTPQRGPDARMAAFIAAGGDPADLCGGARDGQRHDHDGCGLCPAGVSAALPPVLFPMRSADAAPVAVAAPIRATRPGGASRYPPWSGRAPPLV